MKVLVVDDDAGIRQLVRRFLAAEFAATVLEADDGVTALDCLLNQPVDLVVLDLSMRVIGGLETLETIRRSARLAHLPVVLVTGNAEEAGIRRALRLGISEVIVKPLTLTSLRERFSRVFESLREEDRPAVRQRLEIADAHTVLVVDSSAEFRRIAVSEFGKLCRTEEASNEFAALSRCLAGGLEVLVVGSTSELSSAEVFGRKIRGVRRLNDLHIIAAVASAEDEKLLLGLYDATVTRSFVAETFQASLRPILSADTLARLLFHPSSACLATLGDQARKNLSSVLQEEVVRIDEPPRLPTESRHLAVAVEVQAGREAWDLRLTCPLSVALELAQSLRGADADELSEADPSMAVKLLAGGLAQHLDGVMSGHGLAVKVLACRVSSFATGLPPHAAPPVLRGWYVSRGREIATLALTPLHPESVSS